MSDSEIRFDTIVSNTKRKIENAKRWVEDDPYLANYELRDLILTEKAGLKDLSWAMDQSVSLHKNDVMYLIEKLEKYISESC